MSQEDVEIVRRSLDAFDREGIEGSLAYLDPQIEWLGPPEWLEQNLYEGHAGMRSLASFWRDNFDDFRLDIEQLIDLGDEVLVLLYQRGIIKGSATPIEQPIGYQARLDAGKIVRVQVYFSWEAALAAVGLSEQDARADS